MGGSLTDGARQLALCPVRRAPESRVRVLSTCAGAIVATVRVSACQSPSLPHAGNTPPPSFVTHAGDGAGIFLYNVSDRGQALVVYEPKRHEGAGSVIDAIQSPTCWSLPGRARRGARGGRPGGARVYVACANKPRSAQRIRISCSLDIVVGSGAASAVHGSRAARCKPSSKASDTTVLTKGSWEPCPRLNTQALLPILRPIIT